MGCYNSTVVNGSADEVWAALRKFHDMSWSANVITSLPYIFDALFINVPERRFFIPWSDTARCNSAILSDMKMNPGYHTEYIILRQATLRWIG